MKDIQIIASDFHSQEDSDKWSRVACDLWTWQPDSTMAVRAPVEADLVQPTKNELKLIQDLERELNQFAKFDSKLPRERFLSGQVASINLLETMHRPGITPDQKGVLDDVFKRLEIEKREQHLQCLTPSILKTKLALAKIATGSGKLIAEGESSLVAVMAECPELQFNKGIRDLIDGSYERMETTRAAHGLPPWIGKLKPVGTSAPNLDRQRDAANQSLTKAKEAITNSNVNDAIPHFQKAIEEVDKVDVDADIKRLSELFCKRLDAERQVIARQVRKQDYDDLLTMAKNARSQEGEQYSKYLNSGTFRANAGFALLSTGDKNLLKQGMMYLAEAVAKRPCLEFDPDYQKRLRQAFQTFYEDADQEKVADTVSGTSSKSSDPLPPFKAVYQPISSPLKSEPGNNDSMVNDSKIEAYLVDKVTGPALTLAVLALGFRVVNKRIQRYRQANQAALPSESAKPIEEVKPATPPKNAETSKTTDGTKPGDTAKNNPQEAPAKMSAKTFSEITDQFNKALAASGSIKDVSADQMRQAFEHALTKVQQNGDLSVEDHKAIDAARQSMVKNPETFKQLQVEMAGLHADFNRHLDTAVQQATTDFIKKSGGPLTVEPMVASSKLPELKKVGGVPDLKNLETKYGKPYQDDVKLPTQMPKRPGPYPDIKVRAPRSPLAIVSGALGTAALGYEIYEWFFKPKEEEK